MNRNWSIVARMQEADSQVLFGVSATRKSQVRSFWEPEAWIKILRSSQVFLLQPIIRHVAATHTGLLLESKGIHRRGSS